MTREELLSIPGTEMRIKVLNASILQLRSLATSLSAPLGGDKVQAPGAKDRIGNIVSSIVDAEAEMKEDIRILASLRLEAVEIVESLPEPELSVMRLRYIVGMKWEDIADEVGYTTRNCFNIRNKALGLLFGE